MSVWILIGYYTLSYGGGGPLLIDEIASRAECERVRAVVSETMPRTWNARCVEVVRARR